LIFVDYDAITSNALFVKDKIAGKKICAVVKNDAYGHGLVSVAKVLADVVDMYAVGSVDEGMALLQFGKPVLVLIPADTTDTTCAILNGLILTLDSIDTAKRVVTCAKALGRVAHVHIKLDSGMSRLGFSKSTLDKSMPILMDSALCVDGVFSHFACADTDKRFTDCQFDLFCSQASKLQQQLGKSLLKHVANTSAIFIDSRYHLDMVRVGIGLYGYGNTSLIPAKTMCARVVALSCHSKGDIVGYGANFVCNQNTKIAVLDVGYASGLSRQFCSKCIVDINGVRCPSIGSICMGMMMVDATQANVSVGDVVVLFGKSTTWNKHVFMYETLCNTRLK